jgi:segregation and condensation protein A
VSDPLTYKIKLPQFEGPFDLLLFFIERDELDIYDIPIHSLIKDFTDYIHKMESVNIELASEFILFVAILMRIKARMLLPRKEVDEQGNEIDPRQELVEKLLEYRKYKQAALELASKEAERLLQAKRGNIRQDLALVGEVSSEGTEVQTLTLFKLMNAFEKVLVRMKERRDKPQHVVFRYNYTTEGSRAFVLDLTERERTVSFENLFGHSQDRVHAIFLFLSVLELIQQKFLRIMVGEGKNNFIIEYIEPAEREEPEAALPE